MNAVAHVSSDSLKETFACQRCGATAPWGSYQDGPVFGLIVAGYLFALKHAKCPPTRVERINEVFAGLKAMRREAAEAAS